jgi:phosphomevalonate kinase
VRITISYVFAYIVSHQKFRSANIVILADNDYYSQSSCRTHDNLVSLPRFNKLGIPISETNKTGLGSSAALITALTAGLLSFYANIDVCSDEGKRIVHNLAQAAHCAAQGKVGSGFDIAAAVNGSCVYRRFDPQILEHVLLDSSEYDWPFRIRLQSLVGMMWAMEVTQFRLQPGLRVVMGDVAAGSATPSMVRSVLKWKASGSDAEKVWNRLGTSNKQLIEQLNNLKQFSSAEIVAELREGIHNTRTTSNPPVYQALTAIAEEFDVQTCLSTLTS